MDFRAAQEEEQRAWDMLIGWFPVFLDLGREPPFNLAATWQKISQLETQTNASFELWLEARTALDLELQLEQFSP